MPFPAKGAEQACYDALDSACASRAAAFIVEPLVLGAVRDADVFAGGAGRNARRLRVGTLFIADEVMTGWGRTGTLLACEQAGVVPDILCLSKGLTGGAIPLAVTMASEPIWEAHYSTDRAKMFFHSSSYTANPIACAAAAANLAIWRDGPVRDPRWRRWRSGRHSTLPLWLPSTRSRTCASAARSRLSMFRVRRAIWPTFSRAS